MTSTQGFRIGAWRDADIIVVMDDSTHADGTPEGRGSQEPPTPGAALFKDLPGQLRPFVKDGRITAMPARRGIRLLLLNEVAQAFEPGRRYEEAVVNEVLKALHDDHAALRRYLIDEELMSRTPDGTYWRSGGTTAFHD